MNGFNVQGSSISAQELKEININRLVADNSADYSEKGISFEKSKGLNQKINNEALDEFRKLVGGMANGGIVDDVAKLEKGQLNVTNESLKVLIETLTNQAIAEEIRGAGDSDVNKETLRAQIQQTFNSILEAGLENNYDLTNREDKPSKAEKSRKK